MTIAWSASSRAIAVFSSKVLPPLIHCLHRCPKNYNFAVMLADLKYIGSNQLDFLGFPYFWLFREH